MALSGNKGEWSEIYTLFKLLGDGKVHAGDADMNKLDLYYPILNIIREESKRYEYRPYIDQHIVVIDEDGREYARISMNRFIQEAETLLTAIKNGDSRSFEIPDSEMFMNKIGCALLKAPSKDKADIHIVIHDLRTNMTPNLGFSIKSQLGSASTLLNAGLPTNILYRIEGVDFTDEDIVNINSVKEHLLRMKKIVDYGGRFVYCDIEHQTFKNNLLFLDYCMPKFIAECLVVDSMPNKTSMISEAVEMVAAKNPFGFTGDDIIAFYEHKMKVLLLDAALGMTPSKEWKGRYDANGGYLVVRKDGEIVCYHFYNRNDVEDYLYHNTRFERGSRTRHNFGSLFRGNDGNVYIRLNLQIRFKK
ncbi:MAG: HpaII family restriction endonuclease [Bacteroidales bacterium]|nr:HpaII family restriction endonuclease [Candidatus Colimorpha onthohippi]